MKTLVLASLMILIIVPSLILVSVTSGCLFSKIGVLRLQCPGILILVSHLGIELFFNSMVFGWGLVVLHTIPSMFGKFLVHAWR